MLWGELGFEPSNVTTNISTLHIIKRILETSNENPEHSLLKLKESNLHHYLLDTIFFIIIKIFHVKPSVILSTLAVDVAVLEVLPSAFVTSNAWPTSHASTQHAAPLPALNTRTRWGVCVWGGSEGGDWERRENYLTAQREWTKLDRNVPYLVSFCTEEENTNFFAQPLVLSSTLRPSQIMQSTYHFFWTHFEDQTEDGMGYSNSAETKTFLSKEFKVSIL